MDGEAPLATQEQQADAFVNKPKLDASILGKRKRAAFEEEVGSMATLTEAVWGFVGAVKQTIHAEGAPGIFKVVMGCSNFTKAQLMLYLNHLMEHKRSALGFLDMTGEENDLWLTNHLTKHDMLY